MKVVGMTGEKGGQLANLCDFCLQIPSVVTPRIQEAHILIGHIWCEWVEQQIFGA
jgi:D-sedoheptulose 7-phosphate isomerase